MPAVKKSEFFFKVTPKTKDLPTTHGTLALVRDEFVHKMNAMEHRLTAQLEHKTSSLEQEVKSLGHEMKAFKHEVKSEFELVHSEIARVGVIVEEQNSKNNIVLEYLKGLFERQDRVENRVDGVENLIKSIARHR